MSDLITPLFSPDGMAAAQGSRPQVNKNGRMIIQNGFPVIQAPRQMYVNVGGYQQKIVANSSLSGEEWKQLDSTVVPEALNRLKGIMALISRGLTFQLGGIGVLLAQYNTSSEMTAATISLDGHTRGETDRLDYALRGVPVPVIHKPFHIGARELAASRMSGSDMDTSHAAAAARVVAEAAETMLWSGSAISLGGQTIYGLTTHPNVNTGSASSWATAPNAVTNVASMIAALKGDGFFGPYILFVPADQYTEISTVYIASSDQTQLMRIEAMPQIAAVIEVDYLTSGTVVLAQASKDVMDVAFVPGYGISLDENGIMVDGVTTLEWTSGDGMMNYFKTIAIMVPRVKATYSNRSGIVKFTGA